MYCKNCGHDIDMDILEQVDDASPDVHFVFGVIVGIAAGAIFALAGVVSAVL